MAKRFTDTEKWKDEWFLELEPLMKMLWIYMLDTCDFAGVWKVNFKLASYSIGTALDRQSALNALGDRIMVLSLDKWHIPKFITYQQKGYLNPTNNAHKGIINLLEYHNIETSPYLVNAKTRQGLPTKCFDSLGAQVKVKVEVKDSSSFSSSLKTKSALKIDEVENLFNEILSGKGKITHCRGLSSKNIQDFITTTSFEEFQKIETWKEIFQKVSASEFLTGLQQGSAFVATLNWLLIHDNALKVLNGQYGKGSTQNVSLAKSEHREVPKLTDRQKELLKASGQT